MTRAIAFSSYGGPDVLEAIDVEEPEPGAGQVRVRVEAAGVQPFDCMLRRGVMAGRMPVSFPQRLGNEFAGVVDRVSDGVAGIFAGDEVLGFVAPSAYAESVVVGADQVVIKPASMPWEEAGVLSAAGQTAHIALEELKVRDGDTVLIHAAAGGVGTFAVQLARERGATVLGTAGERNQDYLQGLGATPVVYGPGLVDRVRRFAPHGVDAALDAVGGEAIAVSLRLVEDRDRIGSIADYAGAASHGVRFLRGKRTAGRLAELVKLHAGGKLRVHIQNAYPLAEVARAHREVETGHVRGKVVLTVGRTR